MTTILHTASNLVQTGPATQSRRTQPAVGRRPRPASVDLVRRMCDALLEGFVAYRTFERSKSWGVDHDKALKSALGHRPDAR